MLKTLSINLAVFLGFFVFVDLLIGPHLPSLPVFLNSNDEYGSNPRGYFRSHRLSSDGQKYYFIDRSQESDRVPPRSKITASPWRILAIGDSFVYASGVYLEDSFVKKFENSSVMPKGTMGINLGRAGMDIIGIAHDYFHFVDRDLIDVVVYGYVLNDPVFEGAGLGYFDVASNPALEESDLLWDFINLRSPNLEQERSSFIKTITDLSALINSLVSTLELRALSKSTINTYHRLHSPQYNEAGLKKTFDTILEMKVEADKNRSRFVVAILPLLNSLDQYPFHEIHAYLDRELKARDIEVIDLLPIFEGLETSHLWVHPSDQHPNEIAHAMIAQALAPKLAPRSGEIDE